MQLHPSAIHKLPRCPDTCTVQSGAAASSSAKQAGGALSCGRCRAVLQIIQPLAQAEHLLKCIPLQPL